MSRYAERHHPDVSARRLASGIPALNDYRLEGWKQILRDCGIAFNSRATKTELYIAYRNSISADALSMAEDCP
jgi:hypothetical protein